MHMGETKTWYGVPGEDDIKLEEAMKLAAPELFEQQPDLMFQLVTLMSPGRLRKAGVRVYACDQRPNEFVITFPKAYHAGFNHGFNINEAVNFSLPDWLPFGLDCVNRYRELGKHPVFSHDELLVTIYEHEKSPRASRWLLACFKEMVERELRDRDRARQSLPDMVEEVDDAERPEEQYQCITCKAFCYMSQIVGPDVTKAACAYHVLDLEAGPKKLRLRYPDEELRAMLHRVQSRSSKAGRIGPYSLGTVAVDTSADQRKSGRKVRRRNDFPCDTT
jgi:hypothetical protein